MLSSTAEDGEIEVRISVCVGAWVYCLALALPPLFGWSSYNTEGFLTSCSWDYITQSTSNRAYYIYLLTLGFVVPVSVITYCYTFILAAIFAHGKEMVGVKATGGGGGNYGTTAPSSNSRSNGKSSGASVRAKHSASSSTIRTANIIIMLVALFVISWTPYTVVTMIGQFGDVRLVTPWVATMPALFAKASVVYNPIVYGLSHPHFRSSVSQYLSACKTGNSLQNTSMVPVVAVGSVTRKQSNHKHHPHSRAPSSGSAGAAVIYKNPVNHHHIHQTHFRCFPHQNREDSDYFYSEPEPPTRPGETPENLFKSCKGSTHTGPIVRGNEGLRCDMDTCGLVQVSGSYSFNFKTGLI
uniref:(California timema) hypothetical protein n=1 Tax=Timema californicum TaxID=61474 RepID=A0A7R9J5V9_TIMCA|nr:unnamed protein product [Timema californicum]